MPRLPKIVMRKGYAMIETGNGDLRHFDPESDAWILPELAVRGALTEDGLDTLLTAIFDLPEGTETIGRTPTELLGTRLKLKNLATPDRAKAYVRALPGNWIVKDTGKGPWDFAVSKDGIKWHLFDPSPAQSFAEGKKQSSLLNQPRFMFEGTLDLLDITVDALISFGTGAAFVAGAGATAPTGPGAIAAGSAVAGAAAGGMELLKQAIGEAAGIKGNVDVPDAVAMGVITSAFSFAGPMAAKGIRATGRAAGSLARSKLGQATREAILEAGAGLSGIPGTLGFKPERVLEGRIKSRAKIFQRMPGVDRVSDALRRMVQRASATQIPEQPIAAAMEQEATQAGVTINVARMIEDILKPLTETVKKDAKGVARRVARSREGAIKNLSSAENLPSKVEDVIDKVNEIIALGGHDSRAVPLSAAVEIKQALQNLSKDRKAIAGALDAKPKPTTFDVAVKDFRVSLRQEIEAEVDNIGIVAADGSERLYTQVMRDFAKKNDQLSRWKTNLGASQPDEKGRQTAAAFIRSLHGPTKGGFRESAESLKASTGVDILSMAEKAMIAEAFGEQGVAKIFPRISAIGEPVGAGLGKKALGVLGSPLTIGAGGGGIVGGILAGPPGVVAGAALGGSLSSEAGQLAVARHITPAVKAAVAGSGRFFAKQMQATTKGSRMAVIQSISKQILAVPELSSKQAARVSLSQGQGEVGKRLKARNAGAK